MVTRQRKTDHVNVVNVFLASLVWSPTLITFSLLCCHQFQDNSCSFLPCWKLFGITCHTFEEKDHWIFWDHCDFWKNNNLQCGADHQLSFTQELRSSDQTHAVKQDSSTCALLKIFDWLHPVCHVVDPIDGSSASLVQFGYLLQLGLCSTLSYD